MTLQSRPSEKTRQPQPPPQPTPPPLSKRQLYALIASIILIGAVISTFLIYISWEGGITTGIKESVPVIEHTPVKSGVVGESITLKAKVTEGTDGISNVTVHYEWSEFVSSPETLFSSIQHPWRNALMLLIAAEGDEYAYTIPSSEVAGNIDYFIVATDKAGHLTSIPINTIEIADFVLEASTDPVYVYLGETKKTTITVKSIGDFSSEVKLTISDTPYGVEASINPPSVKPPKSGASPVQITISARAAPGTFRGVFELKVTGKSGTAEHSQKIEVIVPNFEMSVSPTSATIDKGETARFDVKISPTFDFKKELRFTLEGLPEEEVEWEITLSDNRIMIGIETVLILKISTEDKVEEGTYPLILNAEGGGIKTDARITLTIE